MLYSGAKGTMTPNNRLQRTAQLGFRLFLRNHQIVELTDAGRKFVVPLTVRTSYGELSNDLRGPLEQNQR
jgi:hypothetical protein